MNSNLKKIREFFQTKGIDEETLNMKNPIALAMQIMHYAHRDQTRENGEGYACHPLRCYNMYQDMICASSKRHNVDLLYKHLIPFYGVMEVCLLHDVIEDTDFTIEDIEEMFVEFGFGEFFNDIMKDALIRITHNKNVLYDEYIDIVIENPISALVKMLDLQDNLTVFDLTKFDEKNFKRANRYLGYLYKINNAYHYIEHLEDYRRELDK